MDTKLAAASAPYGRVFSGGNCYRKVMSATGASASAPDGRPSLTMRGPCAATRGQARPLEDLIRIKYHFYGGPSACSWVCTRERPWLQACARAPIRVQAMRRGTDAWGKTPEKRVVVVPNFDNFDSAWTTTIPRQITIIQSKSAKNLDIARFD